MFLYKNRKKIEPLIRKTAQDPSFLEAYEDLKRGAYKVFVTHDSKAERLSYFAYLSPDPLLLSKSPLFAFSIGIDGSLDPDEKSLSPKEKAFVRYALELETKWAEKSEEELRRRYAPLLKDSFSLLGLSERSLKERMRARDDFLSFMSDRALETEAQASGDEEVSSESLSLGVTLERAREGEFSLSLSLDTSAARIGEIPSIEEFLEAYFESQTYFLGGRHYDLSAAFGKEDIAFLNCFRGVPLKGGSHRVFRVGKKFLSAALNALAGKEIHFEGRPYFVSKSLSKAYAAIQGKQVLLFPPLLSVKGKPTFSYGRSLFLFNADIGVVERFLFEGAKNAGVYEYFLLHPEADPTPLLDLLLPYVDIPNDEEGNAFEIAYYVDINKEGDLSFATHYRLLGAERSEEELLSNARFAVRISAFKEALSRLDIPKEGEVSDQGKVLAFLKADLSSLRKTCSVYLSERFGKTKTRLVGKLSIRLNRRTDWLEASIESKDYTPQELSMILKAYEKKKRFILLHGDVILLEGPSLEAASKAKKDLKLDEELHGGKLPLYEAFSLRAAEGLDLSYDALAKDFVEDILSFAERPLTLPADLDGLLRPYQKVGVKWLETLYEHGLGGVLADDMGLGKTLETLVFIGLLKNELPSLVIVPKSVLFNWGEEAHRFIPELETRLIEGSKEHRRAAIESMKEAKKRLYIISYETLRNDISLLEKIRFDAIIADEAQSIKNAYALRSRAVRSLKGNFRLALTGTPIENGEADLWSIFDFVLPGYLRNLDIFKTVYVMAGDQKKARERLATRIAPFLLRRKKEDVLEDLPPKTVERLSVPLDSQSASLYVACLEDAKKKREELKNKRASAAEHKDNMVSMLALLTKLREICVDPAPFFEGFTEPNAKLEMAYDLIQNAIANGHRVLVFGSFVKVLHHFSSILFHRGVENEIIEGDTPAKRRVELAKEFNENEAKKVMLVSLKAGGTGLNLQGADIVVHLDPWWNLASEEQATDRAYRIGQKRPVTVYKLYSHATIEEKVLALQDDKRDLYADVVEGAASVLPSLTPEDLDFILGF